MTRRAFRRDRAAGRRGRARRAVAAAAVAGCLAGLAGAAQPALAADDCANAEFRTGPAANLPDCRAYELVSPADKESYTLMEARTSGNAVYPSASGDQAYMTVITPFGAPVSGMVSKVFSYRGSDGWEARSEVPPQCDPDALPPLSGQPGPVGWSRDFSTIVQSHPGYSNCDPDDHAGTDLYLGRADEEPIWVSHNGAPKFDAVNALLTHVSGDGHHVLFTTPERLVTPLEDGRAPSFSGLYDRTGAQTLPVGLDEAGEPLNDCGATNAGGSVGNELPGQVSYDGRVIFFTTGISGSVPGCSAATDDAGQLYARVDHERTLLVSASLLGAPESRAVPTFMAATMDGRRVFFRTSERLTEDATLGGGLYRYDLGAVLDGEASAGELTFMTPALTAAAAGIQGTALAMSDDGSRLYFSATGVLDPAAPPAGTKLYLAADGEVTYIPWGDPAAANGGSVSASPDGSKAVFLAAPAGQPTRVTLYDADTDSLTCASCPTGGLSVGAARLMGRGNGGRAESLGMNRFVTDDGRVFFNSLDQLAPRDTNAMYDVYEYNDGEHKLLSSGTSTDDALLWGVSQGGRDAFFTTSDSLVPADFDNGDQDLYTARTGGGFPPPADGGEPCSGDACQGASPVGPAGGSDTSSSYRGSGNVSQPRAARVSLVRAKRAVRGRAAGLRFRVSESGRVVVRGRGIVNVARRVDGAGDHRVRIRLSRAGRRAVARRGRLAIRVTVRFRTPAGQIGQARSRVVFVARRVGERSATRHGRAGGRQVR
ncbi:MAG: hypothetical protein GXY03_00320 [Solirubrobacterales bacterium]|nr:hypothetical protein [Solirubrobacterales bacterium]